MSLNMIIVRSRQEMILLSFCFNFLCKYILIQQYIVYYFVVEIITASRTISSWNPSWFQIYGRCFIITPISRDILKYFKSHYITFVKTQSYSSFYEFTHNIYSLYYLNQLVKRKPRKIQKVTVHADYLQTCFSKKNVQWQNLETLWIIIYFWQVSM